MRSARNDVNAHIVAALANQHMVGLIDPSTLERLMISLLTPWYRKLPATYFERAIGQVNIMSGWFTLFTNCRYILNGELVEDHLVISDETGLVLKREGYIGGEAIDLEDSIIAPGFLELHTNGANGFHFTHYENEKTYATKIDDIARYYATQGVTGFWATLPTVKSDEFLKVRQR